MRSPFLMKTLLPLFFLLLFLSSCTIEDQLKFNKDWSGSYSGVIRPTDEAIAEDSVEDDVFYCEDSVKMVKCLNSFPGISNAVISSKDEGYPFIAFGYDFSSLDAINGVDNRVLDDEKTIMTAMVKWNLDLTSKKSLVLDINREFMSDAPKDRDVCDVKTVFSFHKKIKSLTSEVAQLGEEKNEMVVSYDISMCNDLEKNWKTEVGF